MQIWKIIKLAEMYINLQKKCTFFFFQSVKLSIDVNEGFPFLCKNFADLLKKKQSLFPFQLRCISAIYLEVMVVELTVLCVQQESENISVHGAVHLAVIVKVVLIQLLHPALLPILTGYVYFIALSLIIHML